MAADRAPVLSAAVMTHPARLPAAHQVRAALAPLPVTLAVDPEPDAKPAAMRSARLAYAAADPHATHHLVVQDDVWLPDGFAEAAAASLAQQPDAAISFFVEWGSRTAVLVRWAALTGASWVPMVNPYMPTQAIALPAHLALELAAFLRTESDEADPDDEAVLRFLRRRGTRMLVSVPNLAEHRDLPSLTGNEGHGVRRSACVLGGRSAPLGSAVLALPPLLPFLAWTTGRSTTIDTGDGTYSTRRPTLDVLAGRGYDRERLSATYRQVLAGLADPETLRAGVGDTYLTEVWTTAVATGVLGREQWPAARFDSPVARQALRTLAPGALRTFVDFGVLEQRADDLATLVTAGVRYGWTGSTGPAR